MYQKILYTFLISLYLLSCGQPQNFNRQQFSDATEGNKKAITWQQTSAEYEALCYQAYNIAKQRINFIADETSSKPRAVVLDLDETVLNNIEYNAERASNNQGYTKESWDRWVKEKEATLIAGAKEFIELANGSNLQVFFISNRTQDNLSETIENLDKYGIKVEIDHIFLKTKTSTKSEYRENLLKNYEIVMLIGDNLADFHALFEQQLKPEDRKRMVQERFKEQFGNKFIILPNPIYGDWDSTIKEENKIEKTKNKIDINN